MTKSMGAETRSTGELALAEWCAAGESLRSDV